MKDGWLGGKSTDEELKDLSDCVAKKDKGQGKLKIVVVSNQEIKDVITKALIGKKEDGHSLRSDSVLKTLNLRWGLYNMDKMLSGEERTNVD